MHTAHFLVHSICAICIAKQYDIIIKFLGFYDDFYILTRPLWFLLIWKRTSNANENIEFRLYDLTLTCFRSVDDFTIAIQKRRLFDRPIQINLLYFFVKYRYFRVDCGVMASIELQFSLYTSFERRERESFFQA